MKNIVELKNVSKIYKTGEKEFKALDNIDLSINKGEFVVILGPKIIVKKYEKKFIFLLTREFDSCITSKLI